MGEVFQNENHFHSIHEDKNFAFPTIDVDQKCLFNKLCENIFFETERVEEIKS